MLTRSTCRVLPFPASPSDPRLLHRAFVRDDRHRAYRIAPGGPPGTYQTWVRWNHQPHRARFTRSLVELATIRAQFDREIDELLSDGWTEVQA